MHDAEQSRAAFVVAIRTVWPDLVTRRVAYCSSAAKEAYEDRKSPALASGGGCPSRRAACRSGHAAR